MELTREIAAVVLVLGLLVASLQLLRRYRVPRGPEGQALRSLSQVRLSANLVVHVIECSGERYLLAEQKSGCALLRLSTPEKAC